MPLGDSNDVNMMRYLHGLIVSALSKIIGEVKNNLTPWKIHEVIPTDTQLPTLIYVLTEVETTRSLKEAPSGGEWASAKP